MPDVDRDQWRGILDGALLPIVPLPRTAGGQISEEGIRAYTDWMSRRSVGGVVVGADTVRPKRLNQEQRDGLLVHWRENLDGNQAVIAPVGAPVDESVPPNERPRKFRDDVLKAARRAVKNGANALWCAPPIACKGNEKEADLIVDCYEKLAKLDAALIVGYCQAGKPDLDFTAEVLQRIWEFDSVVAIQVGGCGEVEHQQEICSLLARECPLMPVLTAEHRFLSYGLMLGATGAALECGSCCTDLIAETVNAHADGRYHRFHALYRGTEALARALHAAPANAAVQRILWTLELTGVLPAEAAYDPDAPELPEDTQEQLRVVLEEIGELEPEKKRKKTEEEELDAFLAKHQRERGTEEDGETGGSPAADGQDVPSRSAIRPTVGDIP